MNRPFHWVGGFVGLAALVGGPVAAGDIIAFETPVNEAAWTAAAGISTTSLTFDHEIDSVGNAYWDSHGIGFGTTGGNPWDPADVVWYDFQILQPDGYYLKWLEPIGADTGEVNLLINFATAQRALAFDGVAWTNMFIPEDDERFARIGLYFTYQGTSVGSWVLEDWWGVSSPGPNDPTFVGFTSDVPFDGVRFSILPPNGTFQHFWSASGWVHEFRFSEVPAPGALPLLGAVGLVGRRRRATR